MELLEPSEELLDIKLYRKAILPKWIKLFSYLFLAFSFCVPVALAASIAKIPVSIAFSGFESHTAFSLDGSIVTFLFFVSGIVAYGLLWGKDWAPAIGMGLAAMEILASGYNMVEIGEKEFRIRFEIFFAILFFFELWRLNKIWNTPMQKFLPKKKNPSVS